MDGIFDAPADEALDSEPAVPAALEPVFDFGSNPGALKMFLYTPKRVATKARALVVVLHGCAQTAAGYDRASGWSRLADRDDFMVLLAQQQSANNQQTCFSWFEPGDTRRDGGEALSIRQMIATAVEAGADPKRVYICGLSAGGAMACAMLALYPEIFAGGAIIAGLPFGTAGNVSEAFESMYSGKIRDSKIWGDLVRAANPAFLGPWPTVSIWHGTGDRTVKPINAGELVKQWTNVQGVAADAPSEDQVGGATRRVWRDASDTPRVIEYSIPGMGHGTPVDDIDPPAPFFLPAGLSATAQLAKDWSLRTDDRPPKSLLSRLGLRP